MTLRIAVAVGVTLALAGHAATAQVANGRYQLGACTTHPEETVVRVNYNVLTFYESVCTLSDPTPIQGTNGYSYIGNCAGEGQEWQANMLLIPLQDGEIMRLIRDGVPLDYTRCTP
ncbi:hypothetical protein V8J82_02130 [Gymnodinialimonas sp. 2305UL16-5]|uniref:hypothetical protein n=1 Tax=Gymnodinialimonas mytili TaxID=3126503 RepID=UPI003095A25C